MSCLRYGSSLRVRPISETLALAERIGPTVGVTRVTDTTRLDRIGVPVFAAVRPSALPGSLCVSAGKGLTPDEARIGAYMEAIELAYAEPGRSAAAVREARVAELLNGEQVEELIPLQPLDPARPLPCVAAEEISTGARLLVPAERALFPLLARHGGGLYGSDSNGICSGNTLEEATLHGLSEVIERDIAAFSGPLGEHSANVRLSSLPTPLLELCARITALGFQIYLRYAENVFGLPFFSAILIEPDVDFALHRGEACHVLARVSATRALTEAIQSRLTDIHGGRDDLAFHRYHQRPGSISDDERRTWMRQLGEWLSAPCRTIDFAEVPDLNTRADSIADATAVLIERLAAQGLRRVLRVAHTTPDSPLQVCRILVPGLECGLSSVQRVGARLKRHQEHAAALRRTDAV